MTFKETFLVIVKVYIFANSEAISRVYDVIQSVCDNNKVIVILSLLVSLQIEVTHFDDEDDSLPDDYTLMDVAYIYAWHKVSVLLRNPLEQRTACDLS